ncbi:MAG: MTH1187 family thiamine-binding protein [Candidatus Omnitrophica bacterium]|nr:MTH1187 family thiamine-binding protein [Candidatus Omnitrophota bacterium]MCM8798583.1 MTH1187 family thiamine-binding protein [Candidatus Omnitrophota bacterium]
MPIMNISIIPVGTKDTSLSKYIAIAEKVLLKEKDIKTEITAMGTIVEASSLKKLLEIAKRMHEVVMASGVKRILTKIEIDDRRDKKISIEGKVKSVREKLERR